MSDCPIVTATVRDITNRWTLGDRTVRGPAVRKGGVTSPTAPAPPCRNYGICPVDGCTRRGGSMQRAFYDYYDKLYIMWRPVYVETRGISAFSDSRIAISAVD